MSRPRSIMLIRHGEKPTQTTIGVDANGARSLGSLIPRGWQRAGALACFFSNPPSSVAKPTAIYAVQPKSLGGSSRPSETVSALAAKLGIKIKTLGVNAISSLVDKVMNESGDVLICWEHKRIPKIAAAILDNKSVPKWSGKRFDLVWMLHRSGRSYQLTILPQMLLQGDLPTVSTARIKRRTRH